MTQQPWLHDLHIAVDGPATVLTHDDGSIRDGATGWYVDDRRLLRGLALTLDQERPTPIAASATGATARFWGAARHLGDRGPDPTVEVHQRLSTRGHQLAVEVTVTSRARGDVDTRLCLDLAADGTDLAVVKGGSEPAGPPRVEVEDVIWWSDERHRTTVRPQPSPAMSKPVAPGSIRLTWPLRVTQGQHVTITLLLEATRTRASAFDADAGSADCDWNRLRVDGDDEWRTLVRTNLTDLQHLLQRDPMAHQDVFVAAGTPWYLTLFGRDALWSARMMLPYSSRLAEGTLRALARRQADTLDPATAAEPGKIPHEVRRTTYTEDDLVLPSVYYGTVDATPLWIVLLHEAWQAGLHEAAVRELLPHLQAALRWMSQAVAQSPDGLLRYLDAEGHGLSNQGWKDSGDSMRHADGSVARAPIALIEAQAYAVQAAHGATELLEALGESAEDWHAWASALARRVRDHFWVEDGHGRYLAMALDADGHPVDGVGSNMGHALGTGLLTTSEEALVAERLMRPDMLREFGIATLSCDNPAYNPTGYHTGSVWTHDSAIILRGLTLAGFAKEADRVHDALVRLSTRSRHRFPELIGGDAVGSQPVPYPASCRPQAWAAASAAVLLQHHTSR
ncbi:MAG: glycogen debranching N-terminal domain-containing protein [Ornithinimicrobium sp.]|uniref:glycogen debranching N-terminal domain-containing protein n=1 Tax=Ornithinimicrobium sp. TaxID=1977084 RepID=UPI003D9B1DCB